MVRSEEDGVNLVMDRLPERGEIFWHRLSNGWGFSFNKSLIRKCYPMTVSNWERV